MNHYPAVIGKSKLSKFYPKLICRNVAVSTVKLFGLSSHCVVTLYLKALRGSKRPKD
jgi:hypothetical protein